jgi:hypothetical protein
MTAVQFRPAARFGNSQKPTGDTGAKKETEPLKNTEDPVLARIRANAAQRYGLPPGSSWMAISAAASKERFKPHD